MLHSHLLIESKYEVGAAVVGFLLALLFSHGRLMVGLGALALIAEVGRVGQRIFQHHREGREHG